MLYSDEKLANCARPEIQEVLVVQGTRVQVAKLWANYTDQEKANAINYKFGCGIDVALFLLHLERTLEQFKMQLAAVTTIGQASPDFEKINVAIATLDGSVEALLATSKNVTNVLDKLTLEVERRVTPEYLGRLEASMFDRTDQLSGDLASLIQSVKALTERVHAIETKPQQLEADMATVALPAPYNSGE